MRHWIGWWLAVVFVAPAAAQQGIPPALHDWQDWVLHDVPAHACPLLAGEHGDEGRRCIWPGLLDLDADTGSAHFSLSVRVDAPSWVPLPGDAGHWPQDVSADGKPLPVLLRDGAPAVRLEPGTYALRGMLAWTSRPARLRVPAAIGLVRLVLDGKPVARIERNGVNLTLGEGSRDERAADALALRVYRRLGDGLPAMLTTRMLLDVAGSVRETVLGPVLPPGFVATSLHADLPARMDPDGRLRVQLRPGRWQLELGARALAPLADVPSAKAPAPWPTLEVWSYADDNDLRHTRVSGQAVDAAQAGVPADWRSLPAYVVAATGGDGLHVDAVSRGLEADRADSLTMHRQLWLDFDGGGLSAADRLDGTLRQTQRLDVPEPWQLLRASQQGSPLPIGRHQGRTGVEVRHGELKLDAGLRLPSHAGAFPVSGWSVPLDQVDAVLHLPAGYRLLGAPGADRSPDSWLSGWSLFDLFVVALIALLAGRLLGWPAALLAAAYLALSQDEMGAPRWTLLLVLALLLFARLLPQARLRTLVRVAAGAALALAVLCMLPFAASEMRLAIYPQLAAGFVQPTEVTPGTVAEMRVDDAASRTPALARKAAAEPDTVTVSGSKSPAPPAPPAPPPQRSQPLPAQVPVQAGPGTPAWDVGNDYRLGWSGPVTTTQTARLVIAPSWLVRLLRVVMLLLLATLLAKMLRAMSGDAKGGMRWRLGTAAAALLAVVPLASHARDVPTPELLQQLRARLTEAPACAPDCATLARADFALDGGRLHLDLVVHVGATIALPLPDATGGLALHRVSVDGRTDGELVGDGDALLLRLDRGIHVVGLDYDIHADRAGLHFPLPPQRVLAELPGWVLDGVDDGRLAGDSLGLHRLPATQVGDTSAVVSAQAFAPYVRLTRSLHFGVDWTVHNTVERIAPVDDGFTVSLSLLSGEHPSGDALRVHDGRIDAVFRSGQFAVSWDSRLDHTAMFDLVAPSLADRVEIWTLAADPQWHIDAQGVPLSDGGGAGLLRFQPLPGETLHVVPGQPEAVAGGNVAFDTVVLASNVGERATETTLTLAARSTRGGDHVITLPTGAELLDARRDGVGLSLIPADGKVGLPLLPGTHYFELRFREARGITSVARAAAPALAAPAANMRTELDVPHDRWVLWAFGPANGPAVLYWAQLLVLLAAAWVLARYAPTPLRFVHWLLLGLGFSAFDWSAFALVAVWLILLGVRQRHPPGARFERAGFNLLQFGLAALTVAALLALIAAVPQGLLGVPDMHIAGNGSSAWHLAWFTDRSDGMLPAAGAISLPLWAYKLAMLAWALWLANALIGWLRWAFAAWSTGGYWRRAEAAAPEPAAAPEND